MCFDFHNNLKDDAKVSSTNEHMQRIEPIVFLYPFWHFDGSFIQGGIIMCDKLVEYLQRNMLKLKKFVKYRNLFFE